MFNALVRGFRDIPRRGQHNVVKILCLALGLGLSAVVIAEIYYEQTYDRHYPAYHRICMVSELISSKGKAPDEYSKTSGGVAPLMRKTIAQVELATRTNFISSGEVELDDKRRIDADVYLSDSCFFEMFPAKIVAGDARQGLTEPYHCVVSRTIADRMGGNVVGKHLTLKSMAGLKFTIAAVYEDFPYNSTFHTYDVIGALSTQRSFDFDGQDNLVGNDRYKSFVRLAEGVQPESMAGPIRRMIQTNYPVRDLKQSGVEFSYLLTPISKSFTSRPDVKKMFWILSLLAFVLLATALLNYVLVVVGNLVGRAREMAVRKCYGANQMDLYGITFNETLAHLILAVILGALLVWACQGTIGQMLSAPLPALIFNRGAWILVVIALVVVFVGGIVPGLLYNRIPVAIAFRGRAVSRHRWKVLLLSFEFAMVSFLMALLVVVSLQYRHTVGFDMGYRCDNLAVIPVSNLSAADREVAAQQAGSISGVRRVTACNTLPFYGSSGNNVLLPNEKEELFNIADLYTVADNYFEMMRIPVLAGRRFTHGGDSLPEVMVSREFAQAMKKARGWDDVVGRKVIISEHSGPQETPFTIIGVYDNIQIGNATSNEENRPSAMFYGSYTSPYHRYLLVELDHASADVFEEIRTRLQHFLPGTTVVVESMENMKNLQYTPQKSFRNGVMAAGIVVLAIALIGLVGYVNDEVNRRHKEIAIRKVNGARAGDVMILFLREIIKTALPASVVGAVVAWMVAAQWLMLYDNRISLRVWWFVAVVLGVLLIVVGVTVLNSRRVANSNPIGFLKQE